MSLSSSPMGQLTPPLIVQGRSRAWRHGRLGKQRPGFLATTAREESLQKLLSEPADCVCPGPGTGSPGSPRSTVGNNLSGEQDVGSEREEQLAFPLWIPSRSAFFVTMGMDDFSIKMM